MNAATHSIDRLRDFVIEATRLADAGQADESDLSALRDALARLIAKDDWLPDHFARPHPQYYQQYLLHCDPQERFSLVSFVWGPGQRTPVHDHTVWGLVGMLRGSEINQRFRLDESGAAIADGEPGTLRPGDVEILSPREGDVHQVSNAYSDRVSISIHLYGGNIGAISRHVFDPASGTRKPFVSGYSDTIVPNLWDRSEAVRASHAKAA